MSVRVTCFQIRCQILIARNGNLDLIAQIVEERVLATGIRIQEKPCTKMSPLLLMSTIDRQEALHPRPESSAAALARATLALKRLPRRLEST